MYYPVMGMVDFRLGSPYSYMYFPDEGPEQFLLLDPDNPGGAVRIRMREFRQAYERYLTSARSGVDIRITGYCEFTIGNSEPVTRMCEIVFPFRDGYIIDFKVNIDVYDYARRSIYHVSGALALPPLI